MRVIFNEDHEGYVKFKQRLIESILSRSMKYLYPEPVKNFNTIIDSCLELNEIHVEGRKSRLVLLCFKAQYLGRTKNQFKAGSIVEDIEKQLGSKGDRYLNLLLKVTKGVVQIHQNHFEMAISSFVLAISRLHGLFSEADQKPRYKTLNLAAHYWAAEAYFWQKQYQESERYCTAFEHKAGPLIEEGNIEAKALSAKCKQLGSRIEEKNNQKFFVAKVERKPIIAESIGLKLANVERYRFYNPEAPVKRLDEFWPENDKQTKEIRALGLSIHQNKLSPYNPNRKSGEAPMDFRYRPVKKNQDLLSPLLKSQKRQDELNCSKPLRIEDHKRDHLVTLGRLTSDLRQINHSLDNY